MNVAIAEVDLFERLRDEYVAYAGSLAEAEAKFDRQVAGAENGNEVAVRTAADRAGGPHRNRFRSKTSPKRPEPEDRTQPWSRILRRFSYVSVLTANSILSEMST